MSVKNIKLRFNLDKEDDRRAYEHLREAEQSYSKAVIFIINSYLDRCIFMPRFIERNNRRLFFMI